MKKSWENVWWNENNFVPLHRQTKTMGLTKRSFEIETHCLSLFKSTKIWRKWKLWHLLPMSS